MRSGRPRKLSERTVHKLIRMADQNPHLTTGRFIKIRSGGTPFSQTCTNKTFIEESAGKPYLHPHHKIHCHKYAMEHLQRPDVLETSAMDGLNWNRTLWSQSAKVCLEKERSSISWKKHPATVEHGGDFFMVCGCGAVSRTENIAWVEGRMKSKTEKKTQSMCIKLVRGKNNTHLFT